MVIAVDFDGTLCEHKFPNIGEIKEIHQKVIEHIREAKQHGAEIILWTCREDLAERKYLTEAVEWCKENNIPIDYVNEYHMRGFAGFATRKVCADIYIDDKAVNINDFK
jgi:molybdenum cofactor biosynthesis enzyme MoaA